jgi:hypothetical protein
MLLNSTKDQPVELKLICFKIKQLLWNFVVNMFASIENDSFPRKIYDFSEETLRSGWLSQKVDGTV